MNKSLQVIATNVPSCVGLVSYGPVLRKSCKITDPAHLKERFLWIYIAYPSGKKLVESVWKGEGQLGRSYSSEPITLCVHSHALLHHV